MSRDMTPEEIQEAKGMQYKDVQRAAEILEQQEKQQHLEEAMNATIHTAPRMPGRKRIPTHKTGVNEAKRKAAGNRALHKILLDARREHYHTLTPTPQPEIRLVQPRAVPGRMTPPAYWAPAKKPNKYILSGPDKNINAKR